LGMPDIDGKSNGTGLNQDARSTLPRLEAP
jgi:hypothetical protein